MQAGSFLFAAGDRFAFELPGVYNTTMDEKQAKRVTLNGRIGWRRVGPWFLALMVLSAIVLGPWGPFPYIAGFLKSMLLMYFFLWLGLVGWPVLFCIACVQSVRYLRVCQRSRAGFWSSMALGIALAFVLVQTGKTALSIQFADGLVGRLEIRTDIEAVQAWVELLDPNDCRADPHLDRRGRNLAKEQLPGVLQYQDGMVRLELDAERRPRVRLSWFEGKGGTWGLVIGRQDMRTPPSEPEMYGEQRTELRPGVYFWFVEG